MGRVQVFLSTFLCLACRQSIGREDNSVREYGRQGDDATLNDGGGGGRGGGHHQNQEDGRGAGDTGDRGHRLAEGHERIEENRGAEAGPPSAKHGQDEDGRPAEERGGKGHVHDGGDEHAHGDKRDDREASKSIPRRLDCQCWTHPTLPDHTEMPKRLLDSLAKANPERETVLEWLQKGERDARAETEEKASQLGVDLLPSRAVTIYSDENLQDRAKLEVPLQISYTGIAPVIPSSLAERPLTDTPLVDKPSAIIGVEDLLKELNDVMRTTYTLSTPGLLPCLRAYIDRGFDFGMTYGHLRPFWYDNFTGLQEKLHRFEAADTEKREEALDRKTNWIVNPLIPPRRVWDLYSNRVIPWWIFKQVYDMYNDQAQLRELCAISHSWMAAKRRRPIETPINAHEWPVPIPADTTLDRVRVELLNHGCQYAWLDVLCLQQEGCAEESIRKEEWKVDVPTIGSIYNQPRVVVTYFNGLGRPFYICDMTSERHWLNRTWTLQEASYSTIIGGLTANSPFPLAVDDHGQILDHEIMQFYTLFAKMPRINGETVFCALESMHGRFASHEVDKFAGLAYRLSSRTLPAYIRHKDGFVDEEAAWLYLIETMSPWHRGQLLFLHPASRDESYTWRPTWKQANLVASLHQLDYIFDLAASVYQHHDQCRYKGYCLKNCKIEGLAESNAEGYCRIGTIKMIHEETEHSFEVTAHHQHSIPEGYYFLVGNQRYKNHKTENPSYQYWVVGKNTGSGIYKVSVLKMELQDERDRLERLDLAKRKQVFFI